MKSERMGWRTYELIGLRDLMTRNLRTAGGAPLVECMPCLPDVDVSIPNVSFGQTTAPDFPFDQFPPNLDWNPGAFSIRDGQAYRVRDAVVQGEMGIVTVGDFVIHDTLNFALPGHLGRFEWIGDRALRLPPAGTEARIGPASHLLCGYVGNRNYTHWLTDVVPNLLVYPFHDTFEGTTLLWPKLRNSWQYETLELLPETVNRSKFVEEEEYVSCETLCIVPRIKLSDYFPHPHRMFLFGAMSDRVGAHKPGSRRIYVSRSDTPARRMVNERDVIKLLENHGFETVTLTGMPVADQVALFADASHIVIPHGAALGNVVFCRPGTVVCELHMDIYVQWTLRRLCGLPDVRYGCLVGRVVDRGQGFHDSTWRAPVEQLQKVLSSPPFTTETLATLATPSFGGANMKAAPPSVPFKDLAPLQGAVRRMVIEKLWRGTDPFHGFPSQLYASDTQGWNSVHPYLTNTIETVRPTIVVEIGVWKGGSVLTMASKLRDLGLDAIVIAIDTWLGSWEHWHSDKLFDLLDVMNGHPAMYQKFMSNVVRADLQNYVVPLPLDSMNAAHLLNLFGIRPDIIHLDGCHDYAAVSGDLASWWPLLNDGGVLLGDDYYDTDAWPEVHKAIDDFFRDSPRRTFEHLGGKCRVKKL